MRGSRQPAQRTPSEARYLSGLPGHTEGRRHLSMRDALVRCYALDVPVVDELVVHGIHIATLRALEGHGLVHQVDGLRDNRNRRKPPLWRTTERGAAIVTADEPQRLGIAVEQVEVETTTHPHERMGERRIVTLEEPEPVDQATQARLTEATHTRDLARRAHVADDLLDHREQLERSLREMQRLAKACGVDVRDDLRILTRRLTAMDRKIAEQIRNRAA